MSAEILLSGAIEGGDGAGKYTTQTRVLEELLLAERILIGDDEYTADEFALVATNFPMYWSPIGMAVRGVNRGYADDFFNVECHTFEDKLRLKKSVFALDRLTALMLMDYIEQSIINSTINKQLPILNISDRSDFSHFSTLGYLLSQSRLTEYTSDQFSSINDSDVEFRSLLKTIPAILNSPHVDLGGRKAEDLHETDELGQEIARKGYFELAQSGRAGAFLVETRNESGDWRDPTVIAHEVLSGWGIQILSKRQNPNESFEMTRQFNYARGIRRIMNGFDFYQMFFPQLQISSSMELSSVQQKLLDWHSLFLSREAGKSQIPKKSSLTIIEEELAYAFSGMMYSHFLADSVLEGIDKKLIYAGRRLFREYTDGRLLPLIKYMENSDRIPVGLSRFLEQLFQEVLP